ncbi:MAG: hypothetical protein K2N80_13105 [Lachnospiraceae bacterium]|nr:hypothetical protein [Lachnospiraceae bacterium]
MRQNIQKAADDADYTIEREFLGDITVDEFIEQIIRLHLFPASGHAATPATGKRASNSQIE